MSDLTKHNNNLTVFGKNNQMKERMGWCTISYGKLTTCSKCQNMALYLHQKKQYDCNSYMCSDCYCKK